jgi:arylsulfatase A-like enzyme
MNKKLILPLLAGGCVTAFAAEKPNIILIYIDDMGFSDLNSFGGNYGTPNIDKLATEGIRFSQYYTACPISSPSRTGVTTGMYPTRWGITTFLQTRSGNAAAEQNDFLDSRAPSVARALKENGYATGHFGKWHMGGGRDVYNAPSITSYGFDEYISTWESPDPDEDITATNWIWSDVDNVKRWNRTSYFVDKTLDFLSRNKDKPCYINLWPDDVHTPFVVNTNGNSNPTSERETEASFKIVLNELDNQVGRLIQGLKDLGIDSTTMVIFTSDNGPNPRYDGRRTANMRGQKSQLYEGGIRMPFIVRWPGRIPANVLNSQSLIHAVDIMPSLCALTGAVVPTNFPSDGQDMSSVLLGGPHVERTMPMFWEFGKNSTNRKSPHIGVRLGDWKLLVNANGTNTELYNMETDWLEVTNVAASNPTIVNQLKPMAISWFNTAFRQYADLGTSINNPESDEQFSVFPNPVIDYLNIQTNNDNFQVQVLSIDGKCQLVPEKNATKIDLSSFSKGVYLLMVKSNGISYYKKIIKQ